MKKWTTYLIMALILVPLSIAIEECRGTMTTSDIPCNIISTYNYPLDCKNYNLTIYNSTPINIRNITMGNYTPTGRCNATFNETQVGSYLINTTNGGDSATIIVQTDDKLSIAIVIGLSVFAVAFIATGIFLFYHRPKEEK